MKSKKTKLIAIGLVVTFVAVFAFTMPYMAMAIAPFLLWSFAGEFAGEPPKEQESKILKTLDGLAPEEDENWIIEDMRKDAEDYILGLPPYSYRRNH